MKQELTEKQKSDISMVAKVDWKEITFVYPRITDTVIPLSRTGISPRTFYHWKKEELIELPEFERNDWVRLNIFQYVWLKVIEELRYFGVSLPYILNIKQFVFSNIVDPFLQEQGSSLKGLQKNPAISYEELEAARRLVNDYKIHRDGSHENKIIETRLGAEILNSLVRGGQSSLIVLKKADVIEVDFTSFDSAREIDGLLAVYPNIQIPIKRILQDFFDEKGNEKDLKSMGLINYDEKTVLDAIRSNSYKEIVIKRDGKKKLRIEGVKEKDIIDEQKIKEVKRILGFNEYQEITLIYRNDKHLYLKNKLRLPDPNDSAPF